MARWVAKPSRSSRYAAGLNTASGSGGWKRSATTTPRCSVVVLPGVAWSVARTVIVWLPATVIGTGALQIDQSATCAVAAVKVVPSSDHSTSATPLWVSDAVPRSSNVAWPSTSGRVSPSSGTAMASAGGVMSPTRTVTFCIGPTLPMLSRARKDTVCSPRPGSGTSADQPVVPAAAVTAPSPNCHSTAATPDALSAAVPVMVAMNGGAGRTTSAGWLMVRAGGVRSTTVDRPAVAGFRLGNASTLTVTGPSGRPLTVAVQLVHGVSPGPVGVAATDGAPPTVTSTLVSLSSACRTKISVSLPWSLKMSFNWSQLVVPLSTKLAPTTAATGSRFTSD